MSGYAARVVMLLLTCWSAWMAPRCPAAPAERLLPPETLAVIRVANSDDAVVASKRNATGRLWADPSMARFRDQFLTHFREEMLLPLEREVGINLTNLASLFQGEVSLAFLPDGENKPCFVLLADCGTNTALLATNLALLQQRWTETGKDFKSAKIGSADFATLTFVPNAVSRLIDQILPDPELPLSGGPMLRNPQTKWTIGQSGSLLIIGDSAREIERMLARQAGEPSLATFPAFVASAAQFRDAHATAWANIHAITARMGKPAPPPPPATGDTNSPPATPTSLLTTLGLGKVTTMALSLHESAAGTLFNLQAKVPEKERKGIFRVLALEPKDSSPLPAIPADVVKFRRIRMSLTNALDEIRAMLYELAPAADTLIQFALANAGRDTDEHFDLRKAVVDRLGDDLITYEKNPAGGLPADEESRPRLWLVRARNPEQVAASLKALTSLIPKELARYKQREALGRTNYSATWITGQADNGDPEITLVHYAAAGDYVAISSDKTMLDEYLHNNALGGPSLRANPALFEAAQRVGGLNTGFLSYENNALAKRVLFGEGRRETLNAAALLSRSALGSRLGMVREGGIMGWFDFTTLPAFDRVAKYFHFDLYTISADAGGYSVRYFIPAPPQLKK